MNKLTNKMFPAKKKTNKMFKWQANLSYYNYEIDEYIKK